MPWGGPPAGGPWLEAYLWCCFDSDGSFPSDEGASQEVSESLFIGESKNYGFPGGQNKYAGTGGIDNKMRTLPRNRWVCYEWRKQKWYKKCSLYQTLHAWAVRKWSSTGDDAAFYFLMLCVQLCHLPFGCVSFSATCCHKLLFSRGWSYPT